MDKMLAVTSTKNYNLVSVELTEDCHDIAAQMYEKGKKAFGLYSYKEADPEMVKVWIENAISEGNVGLACFYKTALNNDLPIYTLVSNCGWEQELGEFIIIKKNVDEDPEKKLREDAEKTIHEMFSDWDDSEIADLCSNIIDEVCDDVMYASGYPNYNDSDLRIAIKRTIINLTSVGK
jgi:hypothetical protein